MVGAGSEPDSSPSSREKEAITTLDSSNWRLSTAPHPADTDWAEVLQSPPVRALAETLGAWATGCQRLVLFLPAELSQLPWESLPPSDQGTPALERGVTLSHWRNQRKGREAPVHRSLLARDARMNDFNTLEAKLSARRHGIQHDSEPCAVDLLNGLRTPGDLHLIAHGQFEPGNPWHSELTLHQDERALPAWTLPAAGVRGAVELSVCEAQRYGSDLGNRQWLGPVGIGPAAIAAGAQRVSGPLWACDIVASLFFHARLFELAKASPVRPLHETYAEARNWLRETPAGKLQAYYKKHIDPGQALRLDWHPQLAPRFKDANTRPFDHPYYYAVFAILGDAG